MTLTEPPITTTHKIDPVTTATPELSETRLKSSSLPPGLALSTALSAAAAHLSRSRSNAANISATNSPQRATSQDHFNHHLQKFDEEHEDHPHPENKNRESFFGRLLSRRSQKKQKKEEQIFISSIKKRIDDRGRYIGEVGVVKPKSGAAARQRIDPIDLPPTTPLKAYTKLLDTIVNEEIAGVVAAGVADRGNKGAGLESQHPRQRIIDDYIEPPDFQFDIPYFDGVEFRSLNHVGVVPLVPPPPTLSSTIRPVAKSHSFKHNSNVIRNRFQINQLNSLQPLQLGVDVVDLRGEIKKSNSLDSMKGGGDVRGEFKSIEEPNISSLKTSNPKMVRFSNPIIQARI